MTERDHPPGLNGTPSKNGDASAHPEIPSSGLPLHSFTLSDFSIKNPVFAVMLSVAMIVFGYLGYRELGISQFPEIDFPVVSISTYRDAADPEPMDFDVTDIIEDAVSSVERIDYIQSTSSPGVAVTTVFFRLSRDIDAAMQRSEERRV